MSLEEIAEIPEKELVSRIDEIEYPFIHFGYKKHIKFLKNRIKKKYSNLSHREKLNHYYYDLKILEKIHKNRPNNYR